MGNNFLYFLQAEETAKNYHKTPVFKTKFVTLYRLDRLHIKAIKTEVAALS